MLLYAFLGVRTCAVETAERASSLWWRGSCLKRGFCEVCKLFADQTECLSQAKNYPSVASPSLLSSSQRTNN